MLFNPAYGWMYRHNDLLAGMRDYGVGIAVAVAGLFAQLWRGASFGQRWTLLVCVLVMLVQTQASFPRMMGLVCVALGWVAIREERPC